MTFERCRAAALALSLALSVASCSAGDGNSGTPVRASTTEITVPPLPAASASLPSNRESYPFLASDHDATPVDLGQHGYVEQEFLVSGRANVYSWPDLATLAVLGSGPYVTRILVRRPSDPTRFSGSVRVEPLNPTSGHDLDAEWEIAHNGFMHSGDAYVGVTISPDTIGALKRFDPARYGGLSMASPMAPASRCAPYPGSTDTSGETGLAWDVLSQVGRLVKTDSPANPLHDLHPRISTLTGWSQSGSYDLTYLDAIARHVQLPDGRPIFDGYLPGAGSYAATPISQCAALPPSGDPRARYDPPSGTPVIVVTTPTDFYSAASFDRRTDRPADSDTPTRRIRLYEIGGGSHLPGDQGWYFPNADELARAGFAPEARTTYPLSSFPLHVVLDAAFANLDSWVSTGTAPPHTTRLTPHDTTTWPVVPDLDQLGNPVGGVRTVAVDVPIATFVPRGLRAPHSNNSYYAGYDIPFSPEYLKVLYPTHADYLRKVSTDIHRLVEDRWLTSYDAAELADQARAANIPAKWGWSTRDVTIYPIRIAGDPVLHSPTRTVLDFGDALTALVAGMFESMYAAGGVGLAANQIGVELRVFVYDCPDADGLWHSGVVINPQLQTSGVPAAADPETDSEGCLSVPFDTYPTARAEWAKVIGQDLTGAPIEILASGTLARCFQHEVDHLDGHLFLEALTGEYAEAARLMIKERSWTVPGNSWLPDVPEGTPRPIDRNFPTRSGRVRGPLAPVRDRRVTW